MDRIQPMNFEPTECCDVTCDDIAAYLDGELRSEREAALDLHFAECLFCRAEFNFQKQLLLGLDFSLKDGADIVLPQDFAKVVAANAESTVAGLRRPRERFNALFICGGLGLFVLLSFGVGAGTSLFFEQVAAVTSFAGHFVYEILIGVVVILRTVASHFRSDVLSAFAFVAVAGIILFLARKIVADRLRV
jgi:predicted anti-sigma-YlaC factor YlaD